MFLWRPQDLKAAIDRVEKPLDSDPAWLKGLVDTTKVAVSGHSFGGYTALALAGLAVAVPSTVKLGCDDPKTANHMCKEIEKLGKPPWDFGDPRVKLAIPLAHAFYNMGALQHASAPKLAVPTVMIVGSEDTLTPPATEAEPLYAAMSAPRALLNLHGSSHFSFANICKVVNFAPDNMKAQMQKVCDPNTKPPLTEVHAVVAEYAIAAADLYLKADQSQRVKFSDKAKGDGFVSIKSAGIYQD